MKNIANEQTKNNHFLSYLVKQVQAAHSLYSIVMEGFTANFLVRLFLIL